MAYDNNEEVSTPGTPKKADVLIRSTQNIAAKQDELCEQVKQAIARIDNVLASVGGEPTKDLGGSVEVLTQLKEENSELKQELLYLSKQNENIYSGLIDKLNEMSGQAKHTENVTVDYDSDLLVDLAEKIATISEQNRRFEGILDSLFDKLNDISNHLAVTPAGTVQTVVSEVENSDEIIDRLNRISEQLRRNENSHSMLADKMEILSMRVDQFSYVSTVKQGVYSTSAAQTAAHAPAPEIDYDLLAEKLASKLALPAAPAPVTVAAPAQELDYDKLAQKVAIEFGETLATLAMREAVSADYIAAKVAEQIILPEEEETEPVQIDTEKLAKEVARLIDVEGAVTAAAKNATVAAEIDGDELADKIAEKLGSVREEPPMVFYGDELAEQIAQRVDELSKKSDETETVLSLDEEALADRIAEKLGAVSEVVSEEPVHQEVTATLDFDEDALVEKIVARVSEVLAANIPEVHVDEDELADAVALKVGSIRSDDFEIIVDDSGCNSISREIAQKLDYNVISDIIADKLRETLDLAAANAPDYEDMAERISEKITVAGINEDAIADKAAAVLSNYLPEFDTDEIADKITGAVIDVVSAIPQPTIDTEAICDTISERIIDSQDDKNYDIVIDDDGLNRITAIVSEELEKNTSERFAKLEEGIDRLNELLTAEEEVEETEEAQPEEEVKEVKEEEVVETEDVEDTLQAISEIVAAEIEKGVTARFDRVDDDIAKLTELVSSISVEEVDEEETEEAEEAKATEERESEEVVYDDLSAITDAIAAEAEKLHARFDGLEEKLAPLTDMLTVEDEEESEEEPADNEIEVETEGDEGEYEEEEEDEGCDVIELIAQEIERSVTSRLDSVESKIDNLTGLISGEYDEEEVDESEEYEEAAEEDYAKLSELVAAEVEKGVATRFESVEEGIAKLSAALNGLEVVDGDGVAVVQTETATDDLSARLASIEEELKHISEYVTGDVPVALNERIDRLTEEITKITSTVEGEAPVEADAKFERIYSELEQLSEDVKSISEKLESGVSVAQNTELAAAVAVVEEQPAEEEELVTVSDIVTPVEENENGDENGDFLLGGALETEGDSNDDDDEGDESEGEDMPMPGHAVESQDGVDFANMMKYNRSFIARIIQSTDDCKQYYGELKHALLCYKKVNSNVAWSNERFNKGRETIARMKIRGKTLVLYLALDPNEYKTSVYHHTDVSDNKTVAGTPMMVKVKSPLGVRKAIRLIDDMLKKRDGVKKVLPERNYAAMYPYETIEELIEDGLVKDVK